ncbi:hypothetical protein QP150_18760 [Sphingomonas sp. 22L2VL55-3]
MIVVFISYVAGIVGRSEIRFSKVVLFIFLGTILSIGAAYMSAYRGAIIKGGEGDTALSDTMENPFLSIYASGIDTLDGYRLSKKVQPGEKADPLNLLVAVTTFIPRAVWPDKPRDLSIRITNLYLKWDSGGIFLSLIGYLRIALGGYVAALMGLGTIIFILSSIYIRNWQNMTGFFVILISFRLGLAGSPFDVYYCLLLAVILMAGSIPFVIYARLRGRRSFSSAS